MVMFSAAFVWVLSLLFVPRQASNTPPSSSINFLKIRKNVERVVTYLLLLGDQFLL